MNVKVILLRMNKQLTYVNENVSENSMCSSEILMLTCNMLNSVVWSGYILFASEFYWDCL
jgi:hypothetical protein